MHELAHPSDAHRYMLGLYRVIGTLVSRHPHILFEGCASGGGRLDPDLLHFWPQHWTSDNSDAHDRLYIQFGTTLSYPPSAMGCHVSVTPNHQTGRTIPFIFRAHVAMMGGSFGSELDVNRLSDMDQILIPGFIILSEEISPAVISGEMYRLALPWESNWPAVEYVSSNKRNIYVLYFQIRDPLLHNQAPPLRLDGLGPNALCNIAADGTGGWSALDGSPRFSGDELMHVGLTYRMKGDYASKVFRITRI